MTAAFDGGGEILLVEDSPADVRLMQEALRASEACVTLHVAADGVDAMSFLARREGFEDARRPDLVLLDLNLPRKDGRAVLREIRADAGLRTIPVVVLSTCSAACDIVESYASDANSYVTKPEDFSELLDAVRGILHFWFRTAQLPSRRPRS